MVRFINILVVLLLCTSMSACTTWGIAGAMAVGGAVAYYIHNDQRSAQQIATDLAISAEINQGLQATPNINTLTVNVYTHNQIVTLSGNVYSSSIAKAVEDIALNTRGVLGVYNNLTVVSPYEQ